MLTLNGIVLRWLAVPDGNYLEVTAIAIVIARERGECLLIDRHWGGQRAIAIAMGDVPGADQVQRQERPLH